MKMDRKTKSDFPILWFYQIDSLKSIFLESDLKKEKQDDSSET